MANPDLEKARVRLYEKADRKPAIMAPGTDLMVLADAIVVSGGGRYGKLTPEIKKMAAQITWGVPATEALHLFATRVKTPMIERVVAIIVKSSDAGGDVADVLTMVSHDTKENQLTEDERRIAMSTYIAV